MVSRSIPTGVAARLKVRDTRAAACRSRRSISCAKIGGRISIGKSSGLNEVMQDTVERLEHRSVLD